MTTTRSRLAALMRSSSRLDTGLGGIPCKPFPPGQRSTERHTTTNASVHGSVGRMAAGPIQERNQGNSNISMKISGEWLFFIN